MRKTKKKKTTSGRKQSFSREEVAFLCAACLISQEDASRMSKLTVEETLQSIDSTLKHIEKIFRNKSDATVITSQIMESMTDVLEKSQETLSKSSPKHQRD